MQQAREEGAKNMRGDQITKAEDTQQQGTADDEEQEDTTADEQAL